MLAEVTGEGREEVFLENAKLLFLLAPLLVLLLLLLRGVLALNEAMAGMEAKSHTLTVLSLLAVARNQGWAGFQSSASPLSVCAGRRSNTCKQAT